MPELLHSTVQSSNLATVAYDEESRQLEIRFHSGSVYRYFGVPARVFRGLMHASSHGQFFHRNIKCAGYRYRKMR